MQCGIVGWWDGAGCVWVTLWPRPCTRVRKPRGTGTGTREQMQNGGAIQRVPHGGHTDSARPGAGSNLRNADHPRAWLLVEVGPLRRVRNQSGPSLCLFIFLLLIPLNRLPSCGAGNDGPGSVPPHTAECALERISAMSSCFTVSGPAVSL
jgi:hypothetical protein